MDDDNNIGYFLLGLGVGAAVGLLFAPKPGAETRDFLLSKADQGRDYVRRSSEQLKDAAGDVVDRGKDVLNRQKDQLNQAVEAGKQAYRDAVGTPGDRTVGNEGV